MLIRVGATLGVPFDVRVAIYDLAAPPPLRAGRGVRTRERSETMSET